MCWLARFSNPMDYGSGLWVKNGRKTHKQRISGSGACLGGHFSESGAGHGFWTRAVLVQRFEPILHSGIPGSEKSKKGRPLSDHFSGPGFQSVQCFEPILASRVNWGPQKVVRKSLKLHHFLDPLDPVSLCFPCIPSSKVVQKWVPKCIKIGSKNR